MKNNERILVVVAHPDDEVIGCGGTIAKFSKMGKKTFLLTMTDGVSSRNNSNLKEVNIRKKACLESAKILGFNNIFLNNLKDNELDTVSNLKLTKIIEKIIKKVNPNIIFTHFNYDLNIDHRKVSNAVITACRPKINNRVKKIFFFEVLSSTEWNINIKIKNNFIPNWYENITHTFKTKMKALKCYKRELRKFPHSRSLKGIKILSQYRGIVSGYKNAEAFILGRKI